MIMKIKIVKEQCAEELLNTVFFFSKKQQESLLPKETLKILSTWKLILNF